MDFRAKSDKISADANKPPGSSQCPVSYFQSSLSSRENTANADGFGSTLDGIDAYPTLVSDGPQTPLNQILLPATEKLKYAAARQTEYTPFPTSPGSSDWLPSFSPQNAFLLRTYETGIESWMDVFNCSQSYQQGVLQSVLQLPLLLNSTCALAAGQLSRITGPRTWAPVAEHYYRESLSVLRSSLNNSTVNTGHALVAAILPSCYELMAFPGPNYHRHFRGVKSFVEALEARKSHELGMSEDAGSHSMAQAGPAQTEAAGEDLYCHNALRLCGEVVHFIFGITDKTPRGKKWVNQWSALHSDWNEWVQGYPNTLSGNVSILSPSQQDPDRRHDPDTGAMDPEPQIHHAENVIDIALSNMPDGVLITTVQPVFHATRHVRKAVRRDETILLLQDV
ncbi:uncharacterized protein Z519_05887 [Cladophialophora bantiana CBS 173.52]|uniref:Transcription factor domain-containing protein n=1 Tax=Cladophialophora bantiana (strain ATCC 10958 / CBS 173.52 / CDC B-1940 / NIH 8579) TaxID=1442370 RepID=A0A0D2G3N0_CLAB1|nr:uncharacterized protein Z519_05887 [Cladophialophora bantiana CBS 173.52]KIW93282.1 hypothetical protein Z519_05887 [Cladophialophora bantiana CBS 173.52]